MPKFQTIIKWARFVHSPYTATEMQGFAQALVDSIRARIQSGQNIYDQAAAPSKPGLPGRRGYPDTRRYVVSSPSGIGPGATIPCAA